MVEDIEGLNFEEYGRYEEQQKDWRFVLEENAAFYRGRYTSKLSLQQMRTDCLNPHYYEAEKLFMGKQDTENLREVERLVSDLLIGFPIPGRYFALSSCSHFPLMAK